MINNSTYDQEGTKLSNPNPVSKETHSSGFHNPRIVRVSQAFGGKDRHSKVLTVKGVRDRRIRLSIPTAIQLYNLQDQLGLSQPSKVIDWLLDVTKDDIDKLPPLQTAPQDFNRSFHHPPPIVPHDFNSFPPFFNAPSYNHHHHQPSFNLSLSRSGHQVDTYASLLPSSSATPFEPHIFSSVSGTATPSYAMPFQLLSSSSPYVLPLNLIDTQVKAPFGLDMNSEVGSQSNGTR